MVEHNRTATQQAGYQAASLGLVIGTGILGGIITGKMIETIEITVSIKICYYFSRYNISSGRKGTHLCACR